MLIIAGIIAFGTYLLIQHLSYGQANITFYNDSSLQKQQSTGSGTVTLSSTLTKDNSFSSGIGDLRYILNPATTSIHFSNYPNLDYVTSPDHAWLSVFADGDVYLNVHFKIQTDSNAQPVINSSMQLIDVNAFTRYNLLHHVITGTTIYDTEPGVLSIGDSNWSNAKVTLKTFDNGTGRYSLIVQ